MRIKRFNESEEVNISQETIEEIIKELKEFASSIDAGEKSIKSLLNQLSNYKSASEKGNDQIDNSIFELQQIEQNIGEILLKSGLVLENLENYNTSGRQYIIEPDKE